MFNPDSISLKEWRNSMKAKKELIYNIRVTKHGFSLNMLVGDSWTHIGGNMKTYNMTKIACNHCNLLKEIDSILHKYRS
jgi:hypothetical protein